MDLQCFSMSLPLKDTAELRSKVLQAFQTALWQPRRLSGRLITSRSWSWRVAISRPSSRRIQQSTLERAFSGVWSLPEIGRLEAREASNRAVWRRRLVPEARGIQQSSLESAFSGV